MWLIIKKLVGRLSPKMWLYVFAVLSVLGAFLWFRHTYKQEGKTEAAIECFAEKNDGLTKAIEKSAENKKGREKTDDETRKMPIDDINCDLLLNGWMLNFTAEQRDSCVKRVRLDKTNHR